jgi:RNA 2',3'-cyclic 3'-phosphodiesterase
MQCVFDFCREMSSTPERPERLFFGLVPDAATADRAIRLRDRIIRAHRLEGTRLKTECLHVSLHHVGDYRRLRAKFVYAAQQAAKGISIQPFTLTFRSIASFDIPSRDGRERRRPLALLGEGDGVLALYKALGAAMKAVGLRAGAHCAPHMTLLYGTEAIPTAAIAPIHYAVDHFALIHSELGRTRHTIIDRWPLRGGATRGADPRTGSSANDRLTETHCRSSNSGDPRDQGLRQAPVHGAMPRRDDRRAR